MRVARFAKKIVNAYDFFGLDPTVLQNHRDLVTARKLAELDPDRSVDDRYHSRTTARAGAGE